MVVARLIKKIYIGKDFTLNIAGKNIDLDDQIAHSKVDLSETIEVHRISRNVWLSYNTMEPIPKDQFQSTVLVEVPKGGLIEIGHDGRGTTRECIQDVAKLEEGGCYRVVRSDNEWQNYVRTTSKAQEEEVCMTLKQACGADHNQTDLPRILRHENEDGWQQWDVSFFSPSLRSFVVAEVKHRFLAADVKRMHAKQKELPNVLSKSPDAEPYRRIGATNVIFYAAGETFDQEALLLIAKYKYQIVFLNGSRYSTNANPHLHSLVQK